MKSLSLVVASVLTLAAPLLAQSVVCQVDCSPYGSCQAHRVGYICCCRPGPYCGPNFIGACDSLGGVNSSHATGKEASTFTDIWTQLGAAQEGGAGSSTLLCLENGR